MNKRVNFANKRIGLKYPIRPREFQQGIYDNEVDLTLAKAKRNILDLRKKMRNKNGVRRLEENFSKVL